jgi:hypothetical protein
MSRNITRVYSDKYIPGQDNEMLNNRNTDWLTGPFVKVFYVALIGLSWALIHISQLFSFEDSWTVANMIHGVVSLTLLNSFLFYIYLCSA